MKKLFVIMDGVGDSTVPTPLQAAATPNIDTLASESMTGLFHSYNDCVAPGSDVAHLNIFNQPEIGRGILETLGAGLQVEPGQTCFKCVIA